MTASKVFSTTLAVLFLVDVGRADGNPAITVGGTGSTDLPSNLLPSRFEMGWKYIRGDGVQKDEAKGIALIREDAVAGSARAQNCIGSFLQEGRGGPADLESATKWYRKAAEQGHAEAQYNLGRCLYLQKNHIEAIQWFTKAAEQGVAWAQFLLGSCYLFGNGCEKNQLQAVKWLEKGASQGLVQAQVMLGHCFHDGIGGTTDFQKAAEFYREAAAKNNAEAQFFLGQCYENGEGVAKSSAEAFKMYQIAEAGGEKRAAKKLELLRQIGNFDSDASAIKIELTRGGTGRRFYFPSDPTDISAIGKFTEIMRNSVPGDNPSGRKPSDCDEVEIWLSRTTSGSAVTLFRLSCCPDSQALAEDDLQAWSECIKRLLEWHNIAEAKSWKDVSKVLPDTSLRGGVTLKFNRSSRGSSSFEIEGRGKTVSVLTYKGILCLRAALAYRSELYKMSTDVLPRETTSQSEADRLLR